MFAIFFLYANFKFAHSLKMQERCFVRDYVTLQFCLSHKQLPFQFIQVHAHVDSQQYMEQR